MKPRLLDLFCGAGGAARGYQLAGFDVVGVDMSVSGHVSPMWKAREVMGGIDWMNRAELAESIPAQYAEHIGEQLLEHVTGQVAA